MGDPRARLWRLVVAGVVALALLATTGTPAARSAPTVYVFSLTYQGSCEGFTDGEIRVDGATVELWGGEGGELQKVGSATRQPDDTFTISVPGAGFTMNGQLTDDVVSGSGAYNALGSNCPFTFSGRRVGEPQPTTTSAGSNTTEVRRSEEFDTPEDEFDPSKDGPLSVGELKNVMRRAGLDADEVDEQFKDFDRLATVFAGDDNERAMVIAGVVGALAALTDDDDRPLFPTLATLMTRPPGCARCPSVLARLAGNLTNDQTAEGSADFNRLVRISVAVDL